MSSKQKGRTIQKASNKQKTPSKQFATKYYKSKDKATVERTSIWLLLPIIFIISVLPFIVKLKEYNTKLSKFPWFTYNDIYTDFFLYYKQVFFLMAVFVMAVIALYKAYTDKKNIKYSRLLVPLAIYGALALLSSIVSEHRSYSFHGTYDHFESVFVLLGYCLIVYYCLQIIKTEEDVRLIVNCFAVSVLLMSLLGLTQYIGKDFFASDLGLKLILPSEHWSSRDSVKFNFEANRVYLTFYNPNYVGSYAAMTASFLLVLSVLTRDKKRMIPLYVLAAIGISVSLIGSKSKTGIIGLAIAGIITLIILSRYLAKYFYLSIPMILLVLSVIILYNKANDNILLNSIRQATIFTKQDPPLRDIIVTDDEIVIDYEDNRLHVQFIVEDGYGNIAIKDDDGNLINADHIIEKNELLITDKRYPGFRLGNTRLQNMPDIPIFYVIIDNNTWFFTNQLGDGIYYHINNYGKLDEIVTAPHVLFTGYERYASGRGYIWSRTLPLLKKHIILGSGADTFIFTFPQNDYIELANYGFSNQIMTKPHNLYLQVSVQTGVLSLIAFIVFYLMYFISSFRLYIKGRFKSYYAQVGVAILVASVSYIVLGLANDSSLTVAPVFWVLMGLGITVNRLAKPYILEEIANDKAKKDSSSVI